MRAENILSEPLKKTYRAGVYSAIGMASVGVASLILWSITCLGGAVVELIMRAA